MSQPVNAAPARESPQQEDLSGPPALSGMQYACGSLVCTLRSKLGQMAHQRKGGTTLKVGSSSDAARAVAE